MEVTLKELYKARVLCVSNRSPYIFSKGEPYLEVKRSIGGLVEAVEPALCLFGGLWIVWSGSSRSHPERIVAPLDAPKYQIKFIDLSEQEISQYYDGFANGVLWPLCHYFLEKCNFSQEHWQTYISVNRKFTISILEELAVGDVVWIHDYHLALVPQFVREYCPSVKIVYFWHIPFPSIDLFRELPCYKEILLGLLNSDLIGFHIKTYVENFLDCVESLLNVSVDREQGLVAINGKLTKVRALPLGIDFGYYQQLAHSPIIQTQAENIRHTLKSEIVALGVERLDYTKGILERLQAIELLLDKYPELCQRFSLVQIAAPSRIKIPEYCRFKQLVDATISRINNRFAQLDWVPITYHYQSIPRCQLTAYYQAADILIVVPLRDGMNLVAKEYVASRIDDQGAIVLSKFAGVAVEFQDDAILVNPFDVAQIAESIKQAIDLGIGERNQRMQRLREKVRCHDLNWWLREIFLEELECRHY